MVWRDEAMALAKDGFYPCVSFIHDRGVPAIGLPSQVGGYSTIYTKTSPAWNNATSIPSALIVGETYKGFSIAVAHWFLILLFLIPWLGWLFWHGRRMKRLAASKN